MSFEVGEIVRLKSGGPDMTVEMVHKELREFDCAWFCDDKSVKCYRFHEYMIEYTSEEPQE